MALNTRSLPSLGLSHEEKHIESPAHYEYKESDSYDVDAIKSCHTFWQRPLESFFQNIIDGSKLAGAELNMRFWRRLAGDEKIIATWREQLEETLSVERSRAAHRATTGDDDKKTEAHPISLANRMYLLAVIYAVENNKQAAGFFQAAKAQGCPYVYVRLLKQKMMGPIQCEIQFDVPFDRNRGNYAAENEDPERMFLRAETFLLDRQWIAALELYCQVAKMGHVFACVRIADMLFHGEYSFRNYYLTHWKDVLPEEWQEDYSIDQPISHEEIKGLAQSYRYLSLGRGNYFVIRAVADNIDGAEKALQYAANAGDHYAAEKLVNFYEEDFQKKLYWMQVGAFNGNQLLLNNLGEHYQTGKHVQKNLATALEYYEKINKDDFNIVSRLGALMEQAYLENELEVSTRTYQRLREFIPKEVFGWEERESYKPFHDRLVALYEKKPNDSFLVFHIAILLETIPAELMKERPILYFSQNEPKKSLKPAFNELARRALEGQAPLFFTWLENEKLKHIEPLLEPALVAPIFQRFAEQQADKRTALFQRLPPLSDTLSTADLVLEYERTPKPAELTYNQREQANAFFKIHQALRQRQSGVATSALPSFKHVALDDVVSVVTATVNNDDCTKTAWTLAERYPLFAGHTWQYKKLFREIYQYDYDHSEANFLGFFKRTQVAGKTFYSSKSLQKYLDRHDDAFDKNTLEKQYQENKSEDDAPLTRKIFNALK